MEFTFAHNNFNVLDLDKSIRFYREGPATHGNSAVSKRRTGDSASFFLGDGQTPHQLELTWIKERQEPYNLGENEFHLAFRVDDFQGAHALHEKMGCICYENKQMGIYFINDPDDYWIEIIPRTR